MEDTPTYATKSPEPYCIPFRCENCDATLGTVVNGVLLRSVLDVELSDKAMIFCPECGAANVWTFNRT